MRLTSLDVSFLDLESPCAHMHVGWVALFRPPDDGPRPTFSELRAHVATRLPRAPRYRQRLANAPLGLSGPEWVDDDEFDLDRHVFPSAAPEIGPVVDAVFSVPLRRDRPLWEMWFADQLADGRIGLIGKAHHCMVDGIAAVELASLLLDPTPEPPDAEEDGWDPRPRPGPLGLLGSAARGRVGDALDLARASTRLVRSPGRLLERGRQAVDALGSSLAPADLVPALNDPISPNRHLALLGRRVDELRTVKQRFGTTLNDVLLAVAAGGLRAFLLDRGLTPQPLKAMVPVNVRGDSTTELGNRISFLFVDLPCDEPDPARRLLDVHLATSECKRRGDPEGGDTVLQALGYAPHAIQATVSRLVASPRTFNLVVSNIPGPSEQCFMLGCELEEAYPVVPISDRHALSVGMTTIGDGAFFGLYVDREQLPDAELLAEEIDGALDDLLDRSEAPEPAREPAFT